MFLKWVAGFPGGHYTQRFLVEYKQLGQETEWKQEWYNDHTDKNQEVHMNITGLQPAQAYEFRVLAENARDHNNRSDFTCEQVKKTNGNCFIIFHCSAACNSVAGISVFI